MAIILITAPQLLVIRQFDSSSSNEQILNSVDVIAATPIANSADSLNQPRPDLLLSNLP